MSSIESPTTNGFTGITQKLYFIAEVSLRALLESRNVVAGFLLYIKALILNRRSPVLSKSLKNDAANLYSNNFMLFKRLSLS